MQLRDSIKAAKEDNDASCAVELGEREDLESNLRLSGIEHYSSIQAVFAQSIWLFVYIPSSK